MYKGTIKNPLGTLRQCRHDDDQIVYVVFTPSKRADLTKQRLFHNAISTLAPIDDATRSRRQLINTVVGDKRGAHQSRYRRAVKGSDSTTPRVDTGTSLEQVPRRDSSP